MRARGPDARQVQTQAGRRPPLDGLRVLDLGRYIAAPFCAMLLGDLGADVVKVERPGGEDVRHQQPSVGGDSTYVLVYNRNKRGISLDLRSPDGRDLLRALASRADVLVENFRPGVMAALGCDFASLRQLNPRLVMVSITGFGQDGPYAQRPAFDSIAQAMSGIMSLTGAPDGPPLQAGTFLADYSAGLYAAVGALAALRERDQTGRGQHVDVALLDSAFSLLTTAVPDYALFGQQLPRVGARDRYRSPVNDYATRDGWVYIAAVTQAQFDALAEAIGRPDLVRDPRFATADDRLAHVAALDSEITRWTVGCSTAEVLAILERAAVPCSPVADIAEVIDNPQLRHRGQIVEVDHPSGVRVPLPGVTIKLSDSPGAIMRRPPRVGEHTREVLADWLGRPPTDVPVRRPDTDAEASV